jgi:two-component system KDP operon response regulator KdpE
MNSPTQSPASARKKRILVADDDAGMRLALAIRLRANNYEVVSAGDGLSVVEEARRHTPDLILLDLGMPGGDGFTVMNMLQEEEPEASIPVIVLSGRNRATHSSQVREAGAALFLQKPADTEQLLAAIERVLRNAPVPAAPAKRTEHLMV